MSHDLDEREATIAIEWDLLPTEFGPRWFACPLCEEGKQLARGGLKSSCSLCHGKTIVHIEVVVQYAERHPKTTTSCECGHSKAITDACCARCSFLDGTPRGYNENFESTHQLQDVIMAIRGFGGSTTAAALARELGREVESIRNSIRILRRRGRVRVSYEEARGTLATMICYLTT